VASWILVWFVIGIVSTVAIAACLTGLVRHVLILGRSVKQLRDEIQPIADELADERDKAGRHTSAIGARRRGGSSARASG
jgi:hypothetical protein